MSILNVNGADLFYEVLGNESSEKTVVFLNGVMASTNSWYNIAKVFEALDFKVVLLDFKGQLRSDKPQGPYTFKEHCEETKAILEHLKIDKAHLIGTSYGGEVAMKFAILYPELTESISVIDSVSELDGILEYFVNSWKVAAVSGNGEEFFNVLVPSIYGNTFIKDNKEFLKERAKAMNSVPADYFKGQIELYNTFNNDVYMTNELKNIKCPAMIICGSEDLLKRPKFSKIIRDNIMNSEYVTIPDSGHVAIFEKEEEVKSILLGFILKHMANCK